MRAHESVIALFFPQPPIPFSCAFPSNVQQRSGPACSIVGSSHLRPPTPLPPGRRRQPNNPAHPDLKLPRHTPNSAYIVPITAGRRTARREIVSSMHTSDEPPPRPARTDSATSDYVRRFFASPDMTFLPPQSPHTHTHTLPAPVQLPRTPRKSPSRRPGQPTDRPPAQIPTLQARNAFRLR